MYIITTPTYDFGVDTHVDLALQKMPLGHIRKNMINRWIGWGIYIHDFQTKPFLLHEIWNDVMRHLFYMGK